MVEVRLVGLPVPVWSQSSEHSDALLREFQLLLEQSAMPKSSVPARLVELAEELTESYGHLGTEQEEQVAEAASAGIPTVDLVYHLPPDIAPGIARINELLDEADEYCRDEQLLTLAASPVVLAFRRWFLEEIVRQVEGKEPRPWAAYRSPE